MRKLIVSFLIGCFIGASVLFSLFTFSEKRDEQIDALETLDYVINTWTAVRFDERVARLGLPGARAGYIPDTVYILARRIDSLYRIPKGVVIAQWILESRFGLSDIGANNFFGHMLAAVQPFKKDSAFVLRREKTYSNNQLATGRAVRFASYKNIAECFDTHGRYLSLSKRYRNARSTKSPEAFARELYKAGYATDPDYALKLITIMRRYKL